jgi:hypothetical protein
MAGPGGELAGSEGHGRLRASHADREQVISTLKAAFVRGCLAKDEFDQRVGRVFASRTRGELAALIADLPVGLTEVRPPGKAVRTRARPPIGKVVLAGASVIIPPAMMAAGVLTGDHRLAKVATLVWVIILLVWMGVTRRMLVSRDEGRSGGQAAPCPGQRDRTLEGERDASPGDDLILCQAHTVRPPQSSGHAGIRRTWRPRSVRRSQRVPASLRVTA